MGVSLILVLLAVESLEGQVRACAAVNGESERLACYDRAAASLASDAVQVPQVAEKKTRPAPAASTTAKVTALRESATDGLVIELDNGETWRTIPEDARLLLKIGDTVTISRGVLGSFRLATPGGRVARVNRLR